jgi:hypothetical protein
MVDLFNKMGGSLILEWMPLDLEGLDVRIYATNKQKIRDNP